MRVIADTHVHVYPCYNVKQALDNLRINLFALDPEATCMAFLAERSDCHFFADLRRGGEQIFNDHVKIECFDDAVLIQEENFPDLYVFPGRQIITREKIEILALTIDQEIPDGLAANDVLEKVRGLGGVPVVSWAPGKWFFQRKRVVEKLLRTNKAGSFLVGDTTLRPIGWLQPLLMRDAKKRGFTIVAGSDPLPFIGEERIVGQYATRMEVDFDVVDPVSSMRSLMSRPVTNVTLLGSRGNPVATLLRLVKNAQSKKQV